MDFDHTKGVALADAIDADDRFSFLFYAERRDIDAFVIGVGLSENYKSEVDRNEHNKFLLRRICYSVLGVFAADMV